MPPIPNPPCCVCVCCGQRGGGGTWDLKSWFRPCMMVSQFVRNKHVKNDLCHVLSFTLQGLHAKSFNECLTANCDLC